MKYWLFVLALAAAAIWFCQTARIDVAGPKYRMDGRRLWMPAYSAAAVASDAGINSTPPVKIRQLYLNPDGSCVQCAIGIIAVRLNNRPGEVLLWDTIYGDAIRGGSTPSRVADYCRQRNISIYNVTGDNTLEWAKYAADTGRGAAIFFGQMHFQSMMGRDKARGQWQVCNNNSPQQIDDYSNSDFQSIHLNSGRWIVVFNGPAAPPIPTRLVKS